MCGIVCFYGRSDGVNRVLNALDLLAYRAPDSSGIGVVGVDGQFSIRRAVGTSEQLRAKLLDRLRGEITGGVEERMTFLDAQVSAYDGKIRLRIDDWQH